MEKRTEDFLDILYLFVYKDDSGRGRSKELILRFFDQTGYYCWNPRTKKREFLSIDAVVRFEEVKPGLSDSEINQVLDEKIPEGGQKNENDG